MVWRFSPIARGTPVASNTRIAQIVVRKCRFFEPEDVVRCEAISGNDRLFNTHGVVGVNHESHLFADQFSNGSDSCNIVSKIVTTNLDLDGIESSNSNTLECWLATSLE